MDGWMDGWKFRSLRMNKLDEIGLGDWMNG